MITRIIPKLPFLDKFKTVEFYQKLGFELMSGYKDYLIFQQNELELHFFHFADLIPGKSDFMIYLRIDKGIEDLYQKHLPGNEYMATYGKLNTRPWGQIEFSMIDPSGTCLTFGQSK